MTRFDATLESARGGGAYVEVPPDALAELGGGSRFRVRGTVSGAPLESSTMAMGEGRVCLGIHKATREALGVAPGATLHLDVERDDGPRDGVKQP